MRAIPMALILCLMTGPVWAKPHLRDVPQIDNVILSIAIADKIRKKCPDISARLVRAYSAISSLNAKARDLGYTDAEISAYRNSASEKARIKGKRNAYLAQRGATSDQSTGYCTVGRTEIEKGGQIGALLRMN